MIQRPGGPTLQPLKFSHQSFSQNNSSKIGYLSPEYVRSYAQSPKFDCRKAMKEHNERKRRHQESIRKYDQCNRLIVSRAYEECDKVERESANENIGSRMTDKNGKKVTKSDKENEYYTVTRSGQMKSINNCNKMQGCLSKLGNDVRSGNLLQNSPYYNNGFNTQSSTPIHRSSASKQPSQQHQQKQIQHEQQCELEQLRKQNHYLHRQNSQLTNQLKQLRQGVLELEKVLGQRQVTYSKLKEISPGFGGLWMMNDYEQEVKERQEHNVKELSYMEGDKHTKDTIQIESQDRISLNNKYYHTNFKTIGKNSHNRQQSFQPKSIPESPVNNSLNMSPISQLQQKFTKILNDLKLNKSTSQQSLKQLSHLQQKIDSMRQTNRTSCQQSKEENFHISTNYKPKYESNESYLTRVKSEDRFRF